MLNILSMCFIVQIGQERNCSTAQKNIFELYQSDIGVGQLTNIDNVRENVRNIITDDQLHVSEKKFQVTRLYYHNMVLDLLTKVRKYGPYTFFLTCSVAEFKWSEISCSQAEW